jgi:hypothetical protein
LAHPLQVYLREDLVTTAMNRWVGQKTSPSCEIGLQRRMWRWVGCGERWMRGGIPRSCESGTTRLRRRSALRRLPSRKLLAGKY